MQRSRLQPAGFSLLELMAVVTIIGALAVTALVRISTSKAMVEEKTCKYNVAEINAALERYKLDTGAFPANLSALETPEYFPEGIPVCPRSGTAYSLNTTTHRVDGHAGGSHP